MKTVRSIIEELHKKYFEKWYADDYFDAFLEDYGFDARLEFDEPSFALVWSPTVLDDDESEYDVHQFYVGKLEFHGIQTEAGITEEESKELFKVWIQEHFVSYGKIDTSLFGKIYITWIDMLIEVDYFSIYSHSELVDIFTVTNHEGVLPQAAQSVFLF